jgi:alpha-beta hydrolase superfamily lysophospholipase
MSHCHGEPTYFGPAQRPLFGWIHAARGGAPASDVGLVLCSAFGFDEICSHRAVRHLADHAARRGINAIRFDYDGTGDSAGCEFDEDRVESWLASIQAAIDLLKARTGVRRVCLMGIRLGAFLACAAALRRDDICGLGLILPVAKARTYLREIRAMHTAVVNPAPGDLGDGDPTITESVGFLMTVATTAALESLDAVDPRRKPAPVVLVIDRADLPMARQMADGWREQGADLQYEPTNESESLLKSPNVPDLPRQIMAVCCSWLERWGVRAVSDARASDDSGPAVPSVCSATFAVGREHVREEVRRFGTGLLLGITSLPASEAGNTTSGRRRAGVLLLNSGAVHHVGPSRMYVSLARAWASQGLVVMRVDLAGIGESPPLPGAPENMIYSDSAETGVLEAVQELQSRHGVADVVSIGVCSGAFYSFTAAKNHGVLRGVVLINPLTFYQVAGMALDEGDMSPRAAEAAIESARYGKSIRNWQTWKKALSGKADIASFTRTTLQHAATVVGSVLRELKRFLRVPLPNDLPSDLRLIWSRGVAIAMVFSSHDLGLPRARLLGGSALRRMLGRRQVELHVIDGADHTFMQLKHRKVLQSVLTAIVQGFFIV